MNQDRCNDARACFIAFIEAFCLITSEKRLGHYLSPEAVIVLDGALQNTEQIGSPEKCLGGYLKTAYSICTPALLVNSITSECYAISGTLALQTDSSSVCTVLKVLAIVVVHHAICSINLLEIENMDTSIIGTTYFGAQSIGYLLLERQADGYAAKFSNEAAAIAAGYDYGRFREIIEHDILGFISEDERKAMYHWFDRMGTDQKLKSVDCTSQKDISIRMRMHARRIRTDNDSFVILAAISNHANETDMVNRFLSIIATAPGSVVDLIIEGEESTITFWGGSFFNDMISGYIANTPTRLDLSFPSVHPDDREQIKQAHDRLKTGAKSININLRVQNKYHQFVWINLSMNEYRARDTSRLFSGLFTNIQDKMDALSEVSRSKHELEKVINALPVGIGVFQNMGGRVCPLYTNSQLYNILGMTKEQFDGSFSPYKPYGNIRKESMEGLMQAYLDNGRYKLFSAVCEIDRPDQTSVWTRVVCLPVREENVTTIYAIIYDISNEVQLSRNDRWKTERYRLLIEASDLNVFDYDPETQTLSVCLKSKNQQSMDFKITGITDALRDTERIHPEDKPLIQHALLHAIGDEFTESLLVRLQLHDNGYRWHKVYYKSIKDEYTGICRIIGRFEDVQTVKDTEAALLARAQIETQFRRSSIPGAILSLEFDLETGERIEYADEVSPPWLAKMSLDETITLFRDKAIHPSDRVILDSLPLNSAGIGTHNTLSGQSAECRFYALFNNDQEFRWCRLSVVFARNTFNGHMHLLLYIIDIDDQKRFEQQEWHRINTDIQTGALNHNAFEREVNTCLGAPLTKALIEKPYGIAIVGIYDSGDADDIIWQQHREKIIHQTVRTIKAWMRTEDILGRYGVDEYSILHKNVMDTQEVSERLSVLEAALKYSLAGYHGVTVTIAFTIFTAHEVSAISVLRKVSRALYWSRITGSKSIVHYTQEIENKIRDSLNNLHQQPVKAEYIPNVGAPDESARIYIRTFNHFDVFIDGKAVLFSYKKSKELLALLVDYKGGYLRANEAISCLWEGESGSETVHSRYRKAAMYLMRTLDAYHASDIIEVRKGKRRIVPEKFQCDYYIALQDGFKQSPFSPSSYLVEYSWAENTIGMLENIRGETNRN